MIELHCPICARAGGRADDEPRIGPHTLIAKFDPKDVKLPLTGEMFKSANPERGLADPWHPTAEWTDMRCPWGGRDGHSPFFRELVQDEMDKLARQGGPDEILTNRGWRAIIDNGIEEEEFKHQEDLAEEWERRRKEGILPLYYAGDSELDRMIKLRHEGKSYQQIVDILGLSITKATVRTRIIRAERGKE